MRRKYCNDFNLAFYRMLCLNISPRVGPLETTAADLLVALESSDEEDDRSVPIRAPASGVRTSLPRQHHQHHQSQTTQMQPIEGRQPSLSNGALGAGRQGRGAGASTSLVSSNSNRVGGGGAGGEYCGKCAQICNLNKLGTMISVLAETEYVILALR